MRRLPTLTAAALLAMAGAAQAHPRLMWVRPAANAAVTAPGHVELHFSEKLIPQFSTGALTMAGMKGHAPMKLASAAALARDGRTLVVTPKATLRAGHYRVDWRVVSTDTHHAAGTYAFAVK